MRKWTGKEREMKGSKGERGEGWKEGDKVREGKRREMERNKRRREGVREREKFCAVVIFLRKNPGMHI